MNKRLILLSVIAATIAASVPVTHAAAEANTITSQNTISTTAFKEATKIGMISKKPVYGKVTLSDKLQQYIWELCDGDKELYKTALSVAYVESGFDINIPVSETHDYGLFQINAGNLNVNRDNFAKAYGVTPRSNKKYTPYEFSKMAVGHLKDLQAHWKKKTKSATNVRTATLLSYNRGTVKATKYIKNNGYRADAYVNKVMKFRKTLN